MTIEGYSVEEVTELIGFLTPEERIELHAALSVGGDPWYSLPGPQSDARYSEADITGYGGAAGGGKTDLLCGVAVVDHFQTTIFRNEISQLESVKERLEEIVGNRKGFNGQTNMWRLGKGRRIRFGGFPNPGDEKRYQGSPNDLVEFDEAAEMRETAVRWVIGWNRSAKTGQRTRIIMTFNPPTTPEGRWIIRFFGPWLDKHHPMYPVPFGELRWATTDADGKDYWLTDGREFVWGEDGRPCYEFDRSKVKPEDVIQPMSRTFIPARVSDNPFLNKGEYLARLQNFPEPWRSQMLNGDFEAGVEDDMKQLIPTEWVRHSMQRWRQLEEAKFLPGPMDSMGVDPVMGGKDRLAIARRHGRWIAPLLTWPGRVIPNGATAAALVVRYRRHKCPVHVDIIGWGADTYGALEGQGVQTVAVYGSQGSDGQAAPGLRFGNLRAELHWNLRQALDPDGDDPLVIPDDPELEQELCALRIKPVRGGLLINSKDEIREIINRSPDKSDSVALSLIETPREDEVIDALAEMRHKRREAGGRGDRYDELLEG